MSYETIIAVSALLLSLYGVFATNRHNRLSVRPHIVGSRDKNWTNEGFHFTYSLNNHGFGPARVRKFTLLLDGKPFSPPEDQEPIEALIALKVGRIVRYSIKAHSIPGPGYSIPQNQRYVVLEMTFRGVHKSTEKDLLKLLQGTDLILEYESFYGERAVFRT